MGFQVGGTLGRVSTETQGGSNGESELRKAGGKSLYLNVSCSSCNPPSWSALLSLPFLPLLIQKKSLKSKQPCRKLCMVKFQGVNLFFLGKKKKVIYQQ